MEDLLSNFPSDCFLLSFLNIFLRRFLEKFPSIFMKEFLSVFFEEFVTSFMEIPKKKLVILEEIPDSILGGPEFLEQSISGTCKEIILESLEFQDFKIQDSRLEIISGGIMFRVPREFPFRIPVVILVGILRDPRENCYGNSLRKPKNLQPICFGTPGNPFRIPGVTQFPEKSSRVSGGISPDFRRNSHWDFWSNFQKISPRVFLVNPLWDFWRNSLCDFRRNSPWNFRRNSP